MKRVFYLIVLSFMMIIASCEKNLKNDSTLFDVSVELKLAEANEMISIGNIPVTLSAGEITFCDTTSIEGKALFQVPAGIYTVAASAQQAVEGGSYFSLNASKEGITIDKTWNEDVPVVLEMIASKSGQIIIKEIYTGGTTNPETSKTEAWDKYLTLYNNSPLPATLKNFGIGNTQGNAYASFAGFVNESGNLTYADEDWIPASHGCYYFPEDLVIEPYTDVVIALCGAIDHTQTNAASVDLSDADYVCYDPEMGFNHKKYHPAPSEKIPADHYLKGMRWGLGNSWSFSMFTPAFFIYQTEDKTVLNYFSDAALDVYPPSFQNSQPFLAKKFPRAWILDAVDTYSLDHVGENYKRMTPDLDAGYVFYTVHMGYSLYRNVDKKATEAIPENAGKLVYDYNMGTQDIQNGSTDMSQIDAEASLRNGAKIIYMDTNNSTNDFHMRKQCAHKIR